jgi:predicted O-linked N-acetylglucosamine transferase (SPINDLY family)
MNSGTGATYDDELDLAIRALATGETDIAVGRAESARRLAPGASEPLFVLGLSALSLNDLGSAIRLMDEAHRLDPEGREIVQALAALHGRAGNLTDSLYYSKLALTLEENPRLSLVLPGDFSDFIANIEKARQSAYVLDAGYEFYIRRYDKAADLCRRELKLRPRNIDALQLLGRSLLGLGRYEEASQSLEQACRLAPADANGFIHWTEALLKQGRLDVALKSAREAVRLDPASWAARGQMLTTLAYLPSSEWRAFPVEAAAAAAMIAPTPRPIPPLPLADPKTVEATRRKKLRVAFLVNDTAMQRDIGFFESVIAYHDPRKVYIQVYQQYAHPFGDTPRLQKASEDWRLVYNIDDETLAFIVANDAVDVLIDLCGAAPDGRPAFLARRPAPVQISWLGWPQGGLPGTADVIFSDSRTIEVDQWDAGGTPLHVLPCGLLGYMGASVAIAANSDEKQGPATRNGFVTFGGVLDPARIAGSTETWAGVLKEVPNARLLLGRSPATDEDTRARLGDLFGRQGVGDRIRFQEPDQRQNPAAAFYSAIDVLLDTYPVNGATELCEAMWRGVPAISIRGDRRVGRIGSAILGLAGREEWIADDAKGMASIAKRLASDSAVLAKLRRTLPDEFKQSRLCDAKGFAEEFYAQLETLVARARAKAG